MAKVRRRRKTGMSAYFRAIYEERPDLITSRSNDEVIERWKSEHPAASEKMLKKARQTLANVKSLLKREKRKGGRGKATADGGADATARSRPNLEVLEELIDEGLTVAKMLDRAGLAEVIKLLRRARNQVVWKQS